MTKKQTTYSNGKGDKSRISNHKKYSDNWEKIFEKERRMKKPLMTLGMEERGDEVSDR